VGLGDLPGGTFNSGASGVSGDGSVVVGSAVSSSGPEAFRWTAGGGMQGLGDLSGGDFQSSASAINGDGSVIVGFGAAASGPQAFRWTAAGGMVGLGHLPGGDVVSAANGVSDDGATVVGFAGPASGGDEAFRWTAGTGMVPLGDLADGDFNSGALGVSGDGSVVVGYGNDAAGTQAVLWTGAGMQRLWDVLLANGIDPAADGWSQLVNATAVSLDGSTIAGFGYRAGDGHEEGFVAVVPEPGMAATLGLVAVLSLPRRGRRRVRSGTSPEVS
jgi:probable HAF family extracellular repeat protein